MKMLNLKVSEFADVHSGGTPSTGNPDYWDGDVAWVTPKDLSVHTGVYIGQGDRCITQQGLSRSSACLLAADTVILSSRAPVGYVAIAKSPLATSQGCKNLRCRTAVAHPLYVYYLLKNSTSILESHATGSTYKELSTSRLENITFPLPANIADQITIASILSSYDALIENNRRRIRLLEQAARMLYEEWFVRLRFPGHEGMTVTNGVPEGWERKPLSALCNEVRESVDPKTLPPDTAYIGLEHMPRRSITLNEWTSSVGVESTKLAFREGDVLFGKIRPYFHKVGFTLTDGIASSDAIVIRPADPDDYEYLLLLLSSDGFVSLASKTVREGSKMPRADWRFLSASDVPVPAPPVLNAFRRVIRPVLDQLRNLALSNRRLAAARDLLLPRLMNGEMDKSLPDSDTIAITSGPAVN